MILKLDGKLNPKVVYRVIPDMIKNLSISQFAQSKALKLDKYISDNLNLDITVIKALTIAVSNLQVTRGSDGWYNINVNPNTVFPGTTINIKRLMKFINYGNTEVDGYSILNDVFEFIYQRQHQINDKYTRKRWR